MKVSEIYNTQSFNTALNLNAFVRKGIDGYSSSFYAAGLAVNYVVDTSLLLPGGQITQFKRFCIFCAQNHLHDVGVGTRGLNELV